MRLQHFWRLFCPWHAKPAAAGGVNLEHIARQHLCLADVVQQLHPTIAAHHLVDADRARQAGRDVPPSLSQPKVDGGTEAKDS